MTLKNMKNMPPPQKEHNMLCSFWGGMKSYLERKIDVGCKK